jgi:hypothetical protein
MLWQVTFVDGSYGYVEAMTLWEAVHRIRYQSWNQASQNIIKIEAVDDGLVPKIRDGWYSKSAGA